MVDRWLRHCKDAGHTPREKGGDATYELNEAGYRIYCAAPGCIWRWPNPDRLPEEPL